MSADKKAKKFLGEPLLWVVMAMVGVVLMGPTAANLAKRVVGGDANRGDVDQHGETIDESSAAVEPQLQANGFLPPKKVVSRSSQAGASAAPNRIARAQQGADDSGSAVDLTAADIRRRVQALQEQDQPQGDRAQPTTQAPADDVINDGETIDNDEAIDGGMMEQIERDVLGVADQEPSQAQDSRQSSDRKNSDRETDRKAQQTDDSSAADSKSTSRKQPPGETTKRSDPVPQATETKPLPAPPTRIQPSKDDLTSDSSAGDSTSDIAAKQPASDLEPAADAGSVESRKSLDSVASSDPLTADSPPQDKPSAPDIVHAQSTNDPESNDETSDDDWPSALDFEDPGADDQPLELADSINHFDESTATDSVTAAEPMLVEPTTEAGSWWNAAAVQQFWPERQAQFADIDSVVFAALQNSAQVQILNDQPRIAQTFVTERDADFDWATFVDASWNSVNEPIRNELQTGSRTGRYNEESLHVGSGLQKRLAKGGHLRVGNTIGTLDNNSAFLAPPDQGTATFSLDYRQPLLRGRGREVTQSQIVLARVGAERSEHAAKQQLQAYLVDVVSAYWTLYRARGVLAQRHRNAMRAREITERLSQNDPTPSLQRQLIRANAAAAARQSDVIDAEYAVANAQEQLINLTHPDAIRDSNLLEIIPQDAPPEFMVPHDLATVTELAISNRPEVKQVLAEIKAATVEQVIALDGLKPQLDAIISSYVAGVRGNKDVGNAVYDQFTKGDPSYSVGMSFEVPIGRRAASARIHRQELQKRLLENKLRKTLGDVTLTARSAFRDVYRLSAILQNNRNVVQQATNELNTIHSQSDLLLRKNESAQLYLNDLLTSQNRLSLAEQNLLDSQAQLAIAYVQLKRATGELLQDASGCEISGCQCGQGVADCASCSGSVQQATYERTTYEQFAPAAGTTESNDAEMLFQDMKEHEQAQPHHRYPQPGGGVMPAPQSREQDIPLQRRSPPAGVTPLPKDADTAGQKLRHWLKRSAARQPSSAAKRF